MKAKVKKLWDFPPLSDGKQGRVVTKHFINMSLILNPNHYALLSYLIYQSSADNTIKYSQRLLLQFEKSVKSAREHYRQDNELYLSLPKLSEHFVWLIENGLLLPTEGKIFLINPCLTFSKVYVGVEFYKEWVKLYGKANPADIGILTTQYINYVYDNFKRRGKKP